VDKLNYENVNYLKIPQQHRLAADNAHMRPAGRVFETLPLTIFLNISSLFEIQNVINLNMCYAPGD